MKLSEKQKALLWRIRGGIPKDISYILNVVTISGAGWTERYTPNQFIEDGPSMNVLDELEDIYNHHLDDPHWNVSSIAFVFGDINSGSDPIPDDLLALVREFGLDDFMALPEISLIDSTSFDFDTEPLREDYHYARNSAFIPHAASILAREHCYLALDQLNSKLKKVTDYIVSETVNNYSDNGHVFSISYLEENFAIKIGYKDPIATTLFKMLYERPEIEDVDMGKEELAVWAEPPSAEMEMGKSPPIMERHL